MLFSKLLSKENKLKYAKSLRLEAKKCTDVSTDQMVIEDYVLPFEGKLDANNRWVTLAEIIPWEQIEKEYAELFPSSTGTVAKPLLLFL